MKDRTKRIPKKFNNVNKSFINRLFDEEKGSFPNSFYVFPKKLNFYGKEEGEEIVLVARSHWIEYVPGILLSFVFTLIPFLLISLSSKIQSLESITLYGGFMIVGILLSINILVTTILRWYFTVNIITDQRIVVVRMFSAFYHTYSEAQLEKIEDVTHLPIGFWSNIFDVGDVQIDTAGHEVDFRLSTIPRPREMQDVINDLLEMKQKGRI